MRSPGREFNLIEDVKTKNMYGPEITLLSRPSKMGARWCFNFMSAKEKHTKIKER